MSATVVTPMVTPIAANHRLVRRMLVLFGLTVGVPVLLVIGLIVGVLGGWLAGLIAGVVAGAAAGAASAWRSWSAALDTVLAGVHAVPCTPADQPRLHNLIEGLCVAGGVSKPATYVVRDPSPNSMTAGLSPAAAVLVVTTGLLDGLSRIELEGVLAHELSHVRSGDIVPATVAVSVGGLLRAVPWGRRALDAAVSGRRELTADLAGVSLTRYPPGLLAALEKVHHAAPGPAGVATRTGHLWLRPPSPPLRPPSPSSVARAGGATEPLHLAKTAADAVQTAVDTTQDGYLELRIETLREL